MADAQVAIRVNWFGLDQDDRWNDIPKALQRGHHAARRRVSRDTHTLRPLQPGRNHSQGPPRQREKPPHSPMSWTTQPGSQKRRRWNVHLRLFRRAEREFFDDKVSKKNWCYKEEYGVIQSQKEGCLELMPGITGVVTEVVTGPRKWEIRS